MGYNKQYRSHVCTSISSIERPASRFYTIVVIIFQKVIPADPFVEMAVVLFGSLGDVRRPQVSILHQIIELFFCIDAQISLYPCSSLLVGEFPRPAFEELSFVICLELHPNEFREHLVIIFCSIVRSI